MRKEGALVYILASGKHGTLYVGVSAKPMERIYQHRKKTIKGFTKKYEVTRLVYFEWYDSIVEAISREKHLKKWNRNWKIRLIEEQNPDWHDLAPSLGFGVMDSRLRGNDAEKEARG